MPDALVTFPEAVALAARIVPASHRVTGTGYEDDVKYLVAHEERGGASWDLPAIFVDKATGHVRVVPWPDWQSEGVEGMRAVG